MREEDKLKVIELRGEGLTYREIFEVTGIPSSTIADLCLGNTHKGWQAEYNESITPPSKILKEYIGERNYIQDSRGVWDIGVNTLVISDTHFPYPV